MSTIQAELYEALIEANASKEKAHAAAAAAATITTNYPNPEELATKEYIEKRVAQLEARIAELRSELKVEMANLEGRMDSKMAELKDELKAEIAELRAEMAELKVAIANLEGKMDSKIADLKVCLMQQNRESNRMLIAVIAVATGVIVAAITVLAFIS